MPKFTVIIPTFNRSYCISNAINSVLNQTFDDYELIVIDDGSTDNTKEVVLSQLSAKYYYQENKGVSAARNYGAALAQGDWLVFLDSDDELIFNTLTLLGNSIDPIHNVIKGSYRILRKNRRSLVNHEAFIPGTFTIKRDFFQSLNGYDENIKYAENTELFFRVKQNAGQIKYLSEILVNYHASEHGGSKNRKQQTNALLFILEKHQEFLTNHVKFLYNQIIGVNYLRAGLLKKGRTFLIKALFYKPFKLKTYLRLLIGCSRKLSQYVYRNHNNQA
ncbi:glycosyltransferase family 2 protein [Belliella sp. DSM 111904]|uniref:Glycosyltransferase family 2 protein n=1 Tax=Belliella filtrata TaxID=2923435 RepID=A0ABS9UWV4_9BACT|nr:glycosyltransferase family A protein [Belliella filtrata]MCH7408650.1 glycosyltransferase family 2 protein [Belliella filtrata]